MNNAEKFAEAASEFPEDALSEYQVYDHPLVKR